MARKAFLLIFSTQSQKIQNNVRNLHWSFLTLFGNVIKVTYNYTGHRMTENDIEILSSNPKMSYNGK